MYESFYVKYKIGKITYGVRRILVALGEMMMEGGTGPLLGYWLWSVY